MKFNLVEFKQLKTSLKDKEELSINIVTGSMEPWIKQGESVMIKPCELTELNPYDIIVYWSDVKEILICHIFMGMRDDLVVTKELNLNKEDPPFRPGYILGKVTKPKFSWFHRMLLKYFY